MMILQAGSRLQSALDSAGQQARQIEGLWWIFFWVSVVVWVLVAGALAIALFRRRREARERGHEAGDRRAIGAISVATLLTVGTLFYLLVSSIAVARDLNEHGPVAVTIELTGRQWWWQVDYDHEDKSKRFSTANELYIPVGEPVRVKLRSGDVIHDFWVPSLAGKRDLTPGHDGAVVLRAERAGVYRGQCAEFCGQQHAKMALWVTALPKNEFLAWAEQQRRPSRIPATPGQRKGLETFMNAPCPLCHNIGGTNASGKVAPDLTHFARRRSIAAGTVPNRRGWLAAWILDPQHLKPGSNMPPIPMKGSDLNPLLDYLESLE
jgi:cytochrome c oxidase subunit 2